MELSDKRILVLGANGYIGKNLKKYFENSKVNAHFFSRESKEWSASNYLHIKDLLYNHDVIINLIGEANPIKSFIDPLSSLSNNNAVLLNILKFCGELGKPVKIIFPSSRLVYSGSSLEISEDAPLYPKSIYAANKIACEQYLQAFSAVYSNISFNIVRLGCPYANLIDDHYSYGVIGFFLKSITKKHRITLYGDGIQRRTFTHISDLCKLIMQLSLSDNQTNLILNVPGCNHSLTDVAHLFVEHLGGIIEYIDWPELDLLIETGSTAFKNNDCLRDSFLNEYSLAKWIKTLPISTPNFTH